MRVAKCIIQIFFEPSWPFHSSDDDSLVPYGRGSRAIRLEFVEEKVPLQWMFIRMLPLCDYFTNDKSRYLVHLQPSVRCNSNWQRRQRKAFSLLCEPSHGIARLLLSGYG
jgi:hypothetical protein